MDTMMQTVVQIPVFIDWRQRVWSDAECTAFISWIAANPQAGDVIRSSGGLLAQVWASVAVCGVFIFWSKTAAYGC